MEAEDTDDGEDILSEAKEDFAAAVDAETQNRTDALDDLRFARLGEQWPDAVRLAREREGRPCLTINRMMAFIRQVVNDSRQNKPSIRVRPVDSKADVRTAEILNGVIRNIEHTSKADVAYDTAAEFAVSMGWGYFRITVDYAFDDTFDKDLIIQRIANPFSVYGDPRSTAADSSDWNTCFVTERMTRDEFKRRFKGAEPVDWEDDGYNSLDQQWGDEETVLVAEYWTRKQVAKTILQLSNGEVIDEERFKAAKDLFEAQGVTITASRTVPSHKVTQYLMTGAEILETNEWAGAYIPIVPVYGDEVNIEGVRHLRSLIRDAKDAQRMFNYWRTTSTELVALAPRVPFIGPRGAFNTDADKWASINSTSVPFVEYDGAVPPQRQPLDSGPAAGALQEALNAADDMKSIIGMYDASLGQRSNETSGRAIMARQREGDVSTFHFIDNLSRAIRHAGVILLDLIPTVYSGPRMLRILGEDGTAETVQVNQTTQFPDGSEGIYDLTAGKYDLAVETGPGFTSRREESATQMMELLRAFPQAAPIIGDLLAKNLDWPGADEIAKRLQAMLPPQIRGENPQAEQAQQQVQQAGQMIQALQAQIQALTTDKQVAALKVQIDARKADIDAYKAETERMQVVAETMPMQPEQVQALVLQTLQQVLSSPDVLPVGQAPMPMGAPMMQPGGMPPQ